MRTINPALVGPTLRECGEQFTLEPGYHIRFTKSSCLVIEAGAFVDAAGAGLAHPNVWRTCPRVYELKSYRRGGGKRWRARAGISHFLVIPKDRIRLYLEKGYSFVRVVINGVLVSLNVSGGGGEGWTDYVGDSASISIGHSLADLRRIADAAYAPGTPEAPGEIVIAPVDEDERLRFVRLAAAALVPGCVRAMQRGGCEVVIALAEGYRYGLDTELKLTSYKGGGRTLYCREVRVLYHQVDWEKTARRNAIEFLRPGWAEVLAVNRAA